MSCFFISKMPKTQPKKAVKKVAKKRIVRPNAPPKPKTKYLLKVSMNDEIVSCETNDLKKALLALSPKVFKTKVVIIVKNDFCTLERVLMITRAKMLFRNELNLDVFIKNLERGMKNE